MIDAKAEWGRLDSMRAGVLETARDCAKLTIPALLPPEGHTDNDPLPTPYQSLGARGVNNVASRLLLTLIPPGMSMMKLQVAPAVALQLKQEKRLDAVNNALAEIERLVTDKIETSQVRPPMFETFKHLVVTGNVMLRMTKKGLRMFRMDQYVITRDPDGNPLRAIVKQSVAASTLSPAVCAACKVDVTKKEPVDVYTVIEWDGGRVKDYQQINGELVPGSQSDVPADKSEWLPLRWTNVPGQSWGRGLVEEYLGDLRSLEGISESIVQFAAAAAKIVFLVHPNSQTNFRDITNAESGDAVQGREEDVKVLQMEKYADFQVANATAEKLELRLSHAFLLRSGTIRDAERVTAEEIRDTAQELEDVLGGVYTVLGHEFQLPFVRKFMDQMREARELPALPERVVQPVIVTGFEALGRNHAVNRVRGWIADLRQNAPEAMAAIKPDKLARRLGAGWGVDNLDELIMTPEEMEAQRQQAAAAMIADKAAGPVAGALAKSATQQ